MNRLVDTDVELGKTYYYVLTAQDTSVYVSGYSVEVIATAQETTIIFFTDFEEDDGEFITGSN